MEFNGEAIPAEVMAVVDPIALGYVAGTYMVGIDIEPGLYRITNDTAYAARLDQNLDIIDNELNDNNVLIRVAPSDFALTFNGSLELVEE